MLVGTFTNFLATLDLELYRNKYRHIKLVEMDLPKNIQAVKLLYKIYWGAASLLSFEKFYKIYHDRHKLQLEQFRQKITMCEDCFYRGIEARIYRTWAGLLTQIHAGYVARSVFGEDAVAMSEELDHKGCDIQIKYKDRVLNYQIKKTSHSGVRSGRPLPRPGRNIEGETIDVKYEVPPELWDRIKKNGELRAPVVRFNNDKRIRALENNFVVFNDDVFQDDKDRIDRYSK